MIRNFFENGGKFCVSTKITEKNLFYEMIDNEFHKKSYNILDDIYKK